MSLNIKALIPSPLLYTKFKRPKQGKIKTQIENSDNKIDINDSSNNVHLVKKDKKKKKKG